MVSVSNEEFDTLSKYIYRVSGISLGLNKKYLLETRLSPLLVSLGCSTFSELYSKAKQDSSGELQKKIVDAISTNETYFFRDSSPFEVFKHKIIPELLDKRGQQKQESVNIRIWSAACSTGQEVYTIAISLFEILLGQKKVNFHVTGTDISDEAIAKASYGQYNQFEIERGLAKPLLNKYFVSSAGGYRIKDEIRSKVSFKKINLMEPFYGLGPFDIVFCRNVAIYFTLEDKKKLFQKIARVLTKDGYLVVGGSESLTGVAPQYTAQRYLGATYYQLKNGQTIAPREQAKPEEAAPRQFQPQLKKPQKRVVNKESIPAAKKEQKQKQAPPKQPVKEQIQQRPAENKQDDQQSVQKEVSLPSRPSQGQSALAATLQKQKQGQRLLEKLSSQQTESKKGVSQTASEKSSSESSLLGTLNKRTQNKKNKNQS